MAEEKVEEQPIRLIIGLGKPGAKYVHNVKNAAFITIDYAIEKLKKVHPYEMVSGWVMRPKYMLMTTNLNPLTMVVKPRITEAKYDDMASNMIAYYRTIPEDIYFIYPDIGLALGQYDVGKNLGSAPDPIRKMEKKLATKDFWKVRIGVAGANEELEEIELAKIKFVGEKLLYELEIVNITT